MIAYDNFRFSHLGLNSQNFLRQICKIFITSRCFYKTIIHIKSVIYVFYSGYYQFLLISASKTTLSYYTLKILSPKITKNLANLLKTFFLNFGPGFQALALCEFNLHAFDLYV